MVEHSLGSLDYTYTALSSPVRRQILERLGQGEARVTELAEPFDISLAAVSKHLQLLERAGLVQRRIDGRDHWLSLELQRLSEAGEWIERNRRFWAESLDRLEDLLK